MCDCDKVTHANHSVMLASEVLEQENCVRKTYSEGLYFSSIITDAIPGGVSVHSLNSATFSHSDLSGDRPDVLQYCAVDAYRNENCVSSSRDNNGLGFGSSVNNADAVIHVSREVVSGASLDSGNTLFESNGGRTRQHGSCSSLSKKGRRKMLAASGSVRHSARIIGNQSQASGEFPGSSAKSGTSNSGSGMCLDIGSTYSSYALGNLSAADFSKLASDTCFILSDAELDREFIRCRELDRARSVVS